MPDPLFQTLFNDTEAMTWAPTDVVRDRARRRVRRTQVTVAGTAVVAVGVISGGAAVAYVDRGLGPQPSTSRSAAATTPYSPPAPPPAPPSDPASPGSTAPTTPSAPDAAAIVGALFLQPGDVGSGYRVVSGGESSGDWTFEFSTSMLGCQPPDTTRPDSIRRRDRTLSRGTPQAEDLVTQYVARYRPGNAGRYLAQVRARVNACTPGNGKSIRIGAQRFAGQDALLIEVNYGGGFTTKHVLVRQGDLLTEFFTKPERSSRAAQELGRKAALRLCAGTPVC
jgi:hypothetical protein